MTVLAIDQGTSATKALVVSESGEVLGRGVAPVAPRSRGADVVEQDAHELLESIIGAGRDALAAAGVPVAAVGIANQGETVLRWDPHSGEPLGPALGWQDRRAASVTRALAPDADRLGELTGLPLDPYFAAPKMAWIREREGRGGVTTTIDAWLNQRLTGEYVTDAATASRTLLLDLDSGEWSQEACARFGLDYEQPRIVDCDSTIGSTTLFGGALPVTGLAVDQQAALFAESCFRPGDAKCTYGTGAFLLATTGEQAVRSSARLAACVAWRLRGKTTYCLDGQVYTAGAAVSWLERLGMIAGASALDELRAGDGHGQAVMFVPALAGLGAPFWSPDARAAWFGISLASTREDLIRAVLFGIAANVALIGRGIERDLGRPLQLLRVDGGLSRADVLMQTQADLLQVPVERYPYGDATALGIAALARLGAGLASSPAEAVGAWQPTDVFEPEIPRGHAEERLDRFRAAAAVLAELAADRGRSAADGA